MTPGEHATEHGNTEQEPAHYIGTTALAARLGVCSKTIFNHRLHERFGLRVGSVWRFNWAAILDYYQRLGKIEKTEEPVGTASGAQKTGPRRVP